MPAGLNGNFGHIPTIGARIEFSAQVDKHTRKGELDKIVETTGAELVMLPRGHGEHLGEEGGGNRRHGEHTGKEGGGNHRHGRHRRRLETDADELESLRLADLEGH